jgi:4-carboxymuconolactone decarboxylase
MTDSTDERLQRGLRTIGQLFPPGTPGMPAFEYPPEILSHWREFSVTTVMGDVWGRPQLDLQSRAMVTIAALTALGRTSQLQAYIAGGLNVGLTREQISEVILHMSVYAGFPAAIQAFSVAADVFNSFDDGARELDSDSDS